MEKDSAHKEELVQNGKKFRINKIIEYIALFLAPTATVLLALLDFLYDWQKDKKEEKAKLDSRPYLEAEWGGEVPIGMEDYWRIKLENRNENTITGGSFFVWYTVLLQTEMDVKRTLVWENVFMETEIEYDKDLHGCFLFIKEDFFEHEEQIMEECADKRIDVMHCNSYALCCFQYKEAGQDETVYYLISLKPYEKSEVTVVENPDEYMDGILMDS